MTSVRIEILNIQIIRNGNDNLVQSNEDGAFAPDCNTLHLFRRLSHLHSSMAEVTLCDVRMIINNGYAPFKVYTELSTDIVFNKVEI